MNSEITLLTEPPIIFTKDKEWMENTAKDIKLRQGEIVLLPDDAILLEAPLIVSSELKEV